MDARFARVDERLAGHDARFDRIESRLDEIARELRSQTWRLVTVLVAGMGVAIATTRL
jgi:hypothetical protein